MPLVNGKRVIEAAPAQVSWYWQDAVKGTRHAIAKAMDGVVREMNTEIRRKLDRPYPPASKPKQYPRRRTGDLRAASYMVRKGMTLTMHTLIYGLYLNAPKTVINPAGGRDWIEKIIVNRWDHWRQRLATKARRIMRPTRRRPIRR